VSEPATSPDLGAENASPRERKVSPEADRSWLARVWYETVRWTALTLFAATGSLRSAGHGNIPATGGVLLVSNHLSYLDVFVLGIPLRRRLNYVARSNLFVPVAGALIRSVGGFPIHFEGKGASGVKETLKRLRQGAVVILFPEGSRSFDGRLGPMKPGVIMIAERARVPIVPAAVAGTFEGWPRNRLFPGAHAIRIEYGEPLYPKDIAGLSTDALTTLIHDRIASCHREALRRLARDLGAEPWPSPTPVCRTLVESPS
jgi:1-acyl-sn-glycerol-3-phosphate acyltransferase